ncbi:MAG: hypothetical protein M3P24_00450 [Gemmatimonadota bacterium]|nr:hypothetical protein [Gemmatimonadota bacterium]
MTRPESPRSLRRSYLEWVEEQVENYKESIPRADLLRLADHVVEELRVSPRGQYQITELLLCDAVDRRIIRLLKLPSYRAWAEQRRVAIPIHLARVEAPAQEPAPAAEPVPTASVA